MGVFTYNMAAQSPTDAPVQHYLGTSSGTGTMTLSSEGLTEASSVNPRRISLTETRQIPSGDNHIGSEG